MPIFDFDEKAWFKLNNYPAQKFKDKFCKCFICRSREPGINWPLQFVPEKLGRFENNAEIIQFFQDGLFFI